jgi:hypothetical protein
MEALILAIIIAYAVKKAAESSHEHWQGSKAANRKASKGKPVRQRAASAARHDGAYWAEQVRGGFPQVRHGLYMGWNAGRVAQLEGWQARAQARADHAHLRARATEAVREQRRRQAEALERIRAAARQPGPEPAEAAEAAEPAIPEPQQPAPVPPPPSGSSTTPTEGNQMASDVTYDGVIRAMDSAVMAAEDHGATARTAHKQAARTADQMQALEVDPATLGAMADHLDALDAAVKAQQQVLDTARNVHETLQRGHAQLAEAHKEAVVEAADKAFYTD